MKIEEQVVNLESAKKLKEAGYKQEGQWWWNGHDKLEEGVAYQNGAFSLDNFRKWDKNSGGYKSFVAPTVVELLERLPRGIRMDKKIHIGDFCVYDYGKKISETVYREDAILANALAKMWFYLKKQSMI